MPLIGIVFGLVAACWGLLTDRPRGILAAALGAGGMLLNFAGCAGLAYWAARQEGRAVPSFSTLMIQGELATIVQGLERYHREHGSYPAGLYGLPNPLVPTVKLPVQDRAFGVFNFTRAYQYHVAPDGEGYELFSVGPDTIPGTEDDIWPALSDSALAHSGLRVSSNPPPEGVDGTGVLKY